MLSPRWNSAVLSLTILGIIILATDSWIGVPLIPASWRYDRSLKDSLNKLKQGNVSKGSFIAAAWVKRMQPRSRTSILSGTTYL